MKARGEATNYIKGKAMKSFKAAQAGGGIKMEAVLLTAAALLCFCVLQAAQFDNKARVKELKSRDAKVRVSAAAELSKAKAIDFAEDLLVQLKAESNPEVRISLILSLANIGAKLAVPEIERLAREDKSPDVRSASCLGLGSLQQISSIEVLSTLLLDDKQDLNVKISAASALTSFYKEQSAVNSIEEMLKNGRDEVRFGIVNSLRGIAVTGEGKRLLAISEKDKNESISKLSKELLGKKQ